MEAHLQRVEGEPPVDLDDQFAVGDEALMRELAEECDDLGEKSSQGFAGLAANLDRAALFEDEAAKSVPLRLELPLARLRWQSLGRLRLHRRCVEGQAERFHPAFGSTSRCGQAITHVRASGSAAGKPFALLRAKA